ncbi:MAG TPA: NUDIX hydrolase [Sediminibacterium sp.]
MAKEFKASERESLRDLRWKTLSSKYIYDDRWFRARADSCQFPDGRIIEPYYIVELPDWCNVILVTKDERVILVRQYRYPIDQATYELPGGVIEKNEDPKLAAKREMEEETGYTSDDIEFLMKLSPNPAVNNNTAYFFLVRNAVPTVSTNPDLFEDIDIVSFSKEEIIAFVQENQMPHGVQAGPMYAAMIKLGWLQFT